MLFWLIYFKLFVSLLLNIKNENKKCFISKIEIVNINVIKSSCSGNKAKIANQKNFVHTNYLKINFTINILLYMFTL